MRFDQGDRLHWPQPSHGRDRRTGAIRGTGAPGGQRPPQGRGASVVNNSLVFVNVNTPCVNVNPMLLTMLTVINVNNVNSNNTVSELTLHSSSVGSRNQLLARLVLTPGPQQVLACSNTWPNAVLANLF